MGKKQNVKVVVYRETAYGTPPVSAEGLQLPIVSCGLKEQRGHVQSRLLRGTRNASEPSQGRRNIGGPIVLQPTPRDFAFLLQDINGATATTGTGPFIHQSKTGDLGIGLTVDKYFSDMTGTGCVERYSGVRVNEMTLGASDEGFLEVTLNTMGADEVDDSALLDAAPKLYPTQGLEMPLLTFEEGGAALKIAKDFQLTVANNLDGEFGRTIGNGGKLSGLPEGYIGITFSFNVQFNSFSLRNKAKNNTESSWALSFPTATGGYYVKFQANEVKYELEDPIAEGPGGQLIPMKGTAYFTDDAAASSILLECCNDIASVAAIPA